MGFEPTLFGRAKVQPHYAYQPIAKRHMVYIWPEKMCIFLYLHLKKLALGGIWTHTVRAGEGATTLRVSAHSEKAYGLYLAGKCVFSYTYTWKSWHLVGFEPTMRLQLYAIQIPYAIQKGIWSIFGRKKGVFSYTYTWKSWHLVGFEPTLFGRAKAQPHYAYQPTCQVPQVWWRHCKPSRQYEWKNPD